jgi:hybrid polyketide synthase/nonribosomal peptide synthetase ACE1
MPNQRIFIIDSEMNPVPVGCSGQVVIGGAGVARGYLNQPEINSKSFMADKYASEFFQKQGWDTVHLSGDWGRFDTNGRLVLDGRVQGSTQIKIAGIRIDLEDIENTIVKFASPYIHQVVVSLRNNLGSDDEQFLAAFVVLSGAEPPGGKATFLAQLRQKLPIPQYMRPSVLMAVESGMYKFLQEFFRQLGKVLSPLTYF